MTTRRRVLVIGAGALGSVYGAALATAGAEVQLLARRQHAEAIINAGGVHVDSAEGADLVALTARWRPEDVTPVDTVLLMTKAHDTLTALAEFEHLISGVELAVSFQNGIEKDRHLADWCSATTAIGGMSMVGATLETPGRVTLTLRGSTYVGELPNGTSDRVHTLASELRAGGLPAVVSQRIRAVEWSKLAHAGPTMTITTLSQLPFHQALQDPGMADLYVRLLLETAAVAAADPDAAGLEDLPGMFPVRRLASVEHAEAVATVRELGRQMEDAGATNVIISMLRDRQLCRRLELDAIHGFLIREADQRGIEVPYSRTCLQLLEALGPVPV
jgi:2-dehydropantoate 2-reductase